MPIVTLAFATLLTLDHVHVMVLAIVIWILENGNDVKKMTSNMTT